MRRPTVPAYGSRNGAIGLGKAGLAADAGNDITHRAISQGTTRSSGLIDFKLGFQVDGSCVQGGSFLVPTPHKTAFFTQGS